MRLCIQIVWASIYLVTSTWLPPVRAPGGPLLLLFSPAGPPRSRGMQKNRYAKLVLQSSVYIHHRKIGNTLNRWSQSNSAAVVRDLGGGLIVPWPPLMTKKIINFWHTKKIWKTWFGPPPPLVWALVHQRKIWPPPFWNPKYATALQQCSR